LELPALAGLVRERTRSSATHWLLLLTWQRRFHGGLQFQIEHHLFPRLPRANYRKARRSVRCDGVCDVRALR
jgi:fatty acid desaturase